MFWWKNKKKKKITIELEITEDKNITLIEISKDISTEQYFNFVNSLFNTTNVMQACDKLEMNGETDVYSKFKEQLLNRYMNDFQNFMSYLTTSSPPAVEKTDKEIVKPSKGII